MIIYFKPIFVPKLWGGNKLKDIFHFNIKQENIGEAWLISAIPGYESVAKNTKYKGLTLTDLWKNHQDLFNNFSKTEEFPLLLKLLDATKDLSVQVHPDDEYAQEHMKAPFGKAECWYILDCKENQNLVLGHNAKNKHELETMIHNKEWKKFIRNIKIKPKEIFDLSPGTMHGLCAGTLVYELQQSSDITFRIYDYDRLENGKARDLHIKESIDVIKAPDKPNKVKKVEKIKLESKNKSSLTKIINNKYFELYHLDLNHDDLFLPKLSDDFLLATCLYGDFIVNGNTVNQGESILISAKEIKNGLQFYGLSRIFIAAAKRV